MKSVGQFLREARLKNKLTINQVSNSTKIRPDYLQAIEKNKFHHLPSATFTKGFIRNFALAVDEKPDTALAIFRRDFDQNKHGRVIPRGMTHPLRTPSKFFHPKTTTLLVALIIFLGIGYYLITQILTFTQAPHITLTSPTSDTITSNIVEIKGSTSTDATISVNNQPISLNADGQFQTTLNLSPGDHTLVIKSESRDGKTRTLTRLITVQPPSN
ncbi:helix-turn-helix domain-containing protein [Pseudomonadota bacterium]